MDNQEVTNDNKPTTFPTQDSLRGIKSPPLKHELVASNGTSIHQQHLRKQSTTTKDDLLMGLDLQKLLENNASLKVQFSVVTCTGTPKTGKTSFTHLLMKKNQAEYSTDCTGDHSTIYIKRKNTNLNKNEKWEEINLNELVDQLKKYIHNKEEKITKTSSTQAIEKIKHDEIYSILIMLDISVPTPAIDLLPSSIITFVTYRLSNEEQQSIESLKFSCFLNALMSCNCFKANTKRSNTFDELIEDKCDDKKRRCYTAFVGVYKNDDPKNTVVSVNEKLENLRSQLDHVKKKYPEQISYPYWFIEDGQLLSFVDIENSNDSVAENLCNQMEKKLSQSIIYNIPITWLLLYLQVLKLCEEKEFILFNDILNSVWKTMCKSNDENELKTALSFFHCQEALLYYKDVDGICNYIFKDVRWLFKKITYLLYQMITYNDISAYKKFKHEGILNGEMIFEVTNDSDTENDIKLCDFLKLLVHKKFIFPLNHSKSIEYFIPGALASFDSKSKEKSKICSLQVQPYSLLIVFTCGSFHRLMFCHLAAYLLRNLPQKWSQPGPNNNNERNIFSNSITFQVDKFGHVSFIDRIHFLEIQIHTSSNEEANSTEQYLIYNHAIKALNNACAELNLNHNDLKLGFLCQDCSDSEEHIIIMDKSLLTAYCCITGKYIPLLDYHLKWINETPTKAPMQECQSLPVEADSQTSVQLSKEVPIPNQDLVEPDAATTVVKGSLKNPPTIRQLHWFRDKICHRWFDLGVELLCDDDVCKKLETIKEDHPNDTEKSCSKMFLLWLRNSPEASWEKLISSLRRIKMPVLADKISKAYHGGHMKTQDYYSSPNDIYFSSGNKYGLPDITQSNPRYLAATDSGSKKKYAYETDPIESYCQGEKQVYYKASLPTLPEGGSYVMNNRRNINLLQSCGVDILKSIDLSEILPYLLAKGLLSQRQQDMLSDQAQTHSAKMQYLLFTVLTKLSEDDVEIFLECLQETSYYVPHNNLLKKINQSRDVHT